jgi:hypothetical protein
LNAATVRLELDEMGTDGTRGIYLRHGVNPPLFGVKWDRRKLAKAIGTDHELAMELWDSGEHESRVVAVLAADPALAENGLTTSYFLERLTTIEATIASRPNRTRHTMNGA